MKPSLDKEKASRVGIEIIKGASRGSIVGVAASITTGAAVAFTAPAWLPFVGGALVISGATVATCAAVGAVAGGATGGGLAFWKIKRTEKKFNDLIGHKDG